MTLARISLAFSLLFGARVVWEDVRTQRVRNRDILGGLLFCAAGWALSAFFSGRLPPRFFLSLLEHVGLCSTAAIALWYLHVWPAGDAKLFIAFSCLAVLVDPALRGFPDYLFLKLLVNSFVLAGVFVAALVLQEWTVWLARLESRMYIEWAVKPLSRLVRRLRDAWPHRWNYARCGWNLFVLFLCFQALRLQVRPLAHGPLPQLVVYLALLLAWNPVVRVLVLRETAAWAVFLVTAVLLPYAWARHWDVLEQALAGLRLTSGFFLFFTFARAALIEYLARTRVHDVAPEGLRPGMILSEEGRGALGRAAAVRAYPDGLSEREVHLIRRRLERRRQPLLSVYRARGFALWIFAGFLWTLFSTRNVVELLIAAYKAL